MAHCTFDFRECFDTVDEQKVEAVDTKCAKQILAPLSPLSSMAIRKHLHIDEDAWKVFLSHKQKKNWTKRKHHHFLGEKETAGQMCVYFTYSANNMAMRSCLSVTEDLYWRQIRKMHSLHKRACKYTASLSLNKYIHRGSQKSNTPPQQISY